MEDDVSHRQAATDADALHSMGVLAAENETAIAPKCCCGRLACAFLEHNSRTIEDLEKDLRSAAHVGQALLARHESFIAEAEGERLRSAANIEQLEAEKRQLEEANASTIEENRNLLDHLETLNNTNLESENRIQSLMTTLQATQQELQRMTILAGKAAQLEAQLSAMEIEQAELRMCITTTEEDTRAMSQKWRRSEGIINDLQDQLDKIEREARDERERHVEVVGRMERRRVVEKELESAAGRLKGAAAVNSLGRPQNGSNVVSHFVKDILQDNANLQMGIVELRDLLMGSNAEIESLRDQLQELQPADPNTGLELRLDHELGKNKAESIVDPAPDAIPELHVHHHYHGPERAPRRPLVKKRRSAVTAGHFLSSGASTPRRQSIREWRHAPSSSSTIISQTLATVPSNNRWSIQSTQTASSFAPSSIPSSPRSAHRTSSVFDHLDSNFDSLPTSPEPSLIGSPLLLPRDRPYTLKNNLRSVSTPSSMPFRSLATITQSKPLQPILDDQFPDLDESHFLKPSQIEADSSQTILESPEVATPSSDHSTERDLSYTTNLLTSNTPTTPIPLPADDDPRLEEVRDEPKESFHAQMERPRLRRAASHESILSMSGMDIHTLRTRPSQLLTGRGFQPLAMSPATSATANPATVLSSSKATFGATPISARGLPSQAKRSMASSEYNRSLLSQARQISAERKTSQQPSLGERVGGWVFSKWGVGATTSSASPPTTPSSREPSAKQAVLASPAAAAAAAAAAVATTAAPPSPSPASLASFMDRPPGVNQRGIIKGLKPPPKAPINVEPTVIDKTLLQESLAEA